MALKCILRSILFVIAVVIPTITPAAVSNTEPYQKRPLIENKALLAVVFAADSYYYTKARITRSVIYIGTFYRFKFIPFLRKQQQIIVVDFKTSYHHLNSFKRPVLVLRLPARTSAKEDFQHLVFP